jgi:hypothetical protein
VRGGLALGVVALAAALSTAAGCDVVAAQCGDDLGDDVARYTEGTIEGGVYRTSSWESEAWLDFPARIQLSIEHGLGEVPTSWDAYVAVGRDEALVQASGEEVELVSIDDQAIVVRNPSCTDLVLVLTAEGSTP